jgi:hypothetical protein
VARQLEHIQRVPAEAVAGGDVQRHVPDANASPHRWSP